MQFVRQSKFRHVYCKPMKHEFCLNDIRITKISWDSKFCAVNQKFIAVICEGSGGPFMVLPLSKFGRVEKDYPVVDAHRGACLDLAWCPFNDNVIASCSEDSTAKVWLIPDKGLIRSLNEPIVELLGHQKRVQSVVWHPTAGNVLLTAGGDHKILLWNVGTGEALIELAGHPDIIWSVAFNWNGSKIVTTCKDKKIRVIDPRSGAIIRQGAGHEGMKPQQAIFTRDGRIFSTGFTKRSERMYALRDEEAIDEPIVQEELDTSNGVLFPLYDADSGMLYLCGKGDCSIRFYEINNDPPFVHYINTHTATEPQRGIAFMPKMGLNINENEISRVYKCTNKGMIEVLQFYVPRKSELFQDDLYPDTPAQKPAITADEWMSGKDADPILVPVNPNADAQQADASKPRATVAKKANILLDMTTSASQEQGGAEKAKPVETSRPTRVTATLQDPSPPSPPQPARSPPAPREPLNRARPPSPQQPQRTRDEIAQQSGFVLVDRNTHPEAVGTRMNESPHAAAHIREMAEQASAGASSSAEQQRWAARLEKLQEQPAMSNSHPAADRKTSRQELSRQNSDISSSGGTTVIRVGEKEVNMEELLSDVHKMKLIIRKHERRIRQLEELLADSQLKDLDSL